MLLLVIYIAFIGLGIPDSLFGTAWPAIYREFSLPVSSANYVSLLISGGTVISSLLSDRIINKFGTAKVTAVSTAVTAAALAGFSLSSNLVWLCIFALPLGIGAGAVDIALNNYVALHYKAAHMNFLHCFYGIGVSLSPYVMSLALSQSDWRSGYRSVFFVQLAIAAIVVLSMPLWRKNELTADSSENGFKPKNLTFPELFKNPSVRASWFMFISSCGLEYTCGVWGSTFLVNSRGLAADKAAGFIMLYYMGMALGRFLSGILSARLSCGRIIHAGQIILVPAIALLFLPFPAAGAIGLFLVGIGNGPIFPNLLHLTPELFGRDVSQSVMGSQMASAYTGIMLIPPLFGLIAQNFTTHIFPYYIAVLFAGMILSMVVMRRLTQKNKLI